MCLNLNLDGVALAVEHIVEDLKAGYIKARVGCGEAHEWLGSSGVQSDACCQVRERQSCRLGKCVQAEGRVRKPTIDFCLGGRSLPGFVTGASRPADVTALHHQDGSQELTIKMVGGGQQLAVGLSIGRRARWFDEAAQGPLQCRRWNLVLGSVPLWALQSAPNSQKLRKAAGNLWRRLLIPLGSARRRRLTNRSRQDGAPSTSQTRR